MRRTAGAILVSGLLAAVPTRARANGAFPDAQSVITRADRPDEVILATNFGLVISEDGGQSWQWSCERDTPDRKTAHAKCENRPAARRG